MSKSNAGRPTVMNEETLAKLEWAFIRGFSDREACLYAKINPATLYRYQEDNPEYSEHKETLKDSPKMKAKEVTYEHLTQGDKDIAKFVLERRDPDYVKKSETKNETNLKVEGLTMEKALEMDIEELDKIINDK